MGYPIYIEGCEDLELVTYYLSMDRSHCDKVGNIKLSFIHNKKIDNQLGSKCYLYQRPLLYYGTILELNCELDWQLSNFIYSAIVRNSDILGPAYNIKNTWDIIGYLMYQKI